MNADIHISLVNDSKESKKRIQLTNVIFLLRPAYDDAFALNQNVAGLWGLEALDESAPISVFGTGPDFSAATDKGLPRAATLLELSVPEVKNGATITGAIEIGHNPGVVQITFRAPSDRLEKHGLLPFVLDQYGIG